MSGQDLTADLQQRVQQALAEQTPLRIFGGDSKAFYRLPSQATEKLTLTGHSGIIAYRPSESVITVRTGTTLAELNAVLAEQNQMLAFEPPLFSSNATVGGMLASGLSGPRRAFAGSCRDFMLGCKLINGFGEILTFGGQVMKNVAGFDVPRLMVGAQGTLGVLLEASLRVMPQPEYELTLAKPINDTSNALALMSQWARQPWPLSALAFDGEAVHYRLSGAEAAIKTAAKKLGGQEQDGVFWESLREQRLPFFSGDLPLWRISIAPTAPMPDLPGTWFLDWGGALRWLKSGVPAKQIHEVMHAMGGHAYGFKNIRPTSERQSLVNDIVALQLRIKQAFDPENIFNPTS